MKFNCGRWSFALAIAVLLVLPFRAECQSRHMGMPGHHYDPSTEVTLQGTVTEVKEVECDTCGSGMGTHLVLKTGSESLEVMLGPTAFLNKHDFTFAKGEQIEVTGAKSKIDGQDALLAREVKKGEKTLALRDKTGRPMWAGRRGPRR